MKKDIKGDDRYEISNFIHFIESGQFLSVEEAQRAIQERTYVQHDSLSFLAFNKYNTLQELKHALENI